jgi:hypothetical protein
MPDLTLSALAAAWRTSLIAIALLTGALVIAPYWDASIYMRALREALVSTPM